MGEETGVLTEQWEIVRQYTRPLKQRKMDGNSGERVAMYSTCLSSTPLDRIIMNRLTDEGTVFLLGLVIHTLLGQRNHIGSVCSYIIQLKLTLSSINIKHSTHSAKAVINHLPYHTAVPLTTSFSGHFYFTFIVKYCLQHLIIHKCNWHYNTEILVQIFVKTKQNKIK